MIDLIHGDCLEEMKTIPDGSIDLVLTDPPYELGFMGKSWDNTGIANNVKMWREVLRVLKPGGYCLSFGGTRTYHRMACAIEDAGFEIRDMINWCYGSGFPKSLNIGKAVDKLGGVHPNWKPLEYEKAVRNSGRTHSDIDQYLGLKASSCYWSRTDHRKCTPLYKHWILIKEYLNLDDNFAQLVPETERDILGQKQVMGKDNNIIYGKYKGGTVDITKGTSEWEGWGTALKPAHEPICMARKPLAEKTVAENCLKWGTGGINIDESRVATDENLNGGGYSKNFNGSSFLKYGGKLEYTQPTGRFPANLITDGSDEVRECFPETKASKPRYDNREKQEKVATNFVHGASSDISDNGGNASRFFKSIIYQAKASKSERNKGCEGLEVQSNMRVNAPRENEEEKTANKMGNHHPTIKPIALMEYLIKMVTPKG